MQGGFEEPLRVGECPINDYDPEDEYDYDLEHEMEDYLDNITWVSTEDDIEEVVCPVEDYDFSIPFYPEPVTRLSPEDLHRAYEILRRDEILRRAHPTLIEEVENQPRLSHLEELSEKYKENIEELNY